MSKRPLIFKGPSDPNDGNRKLPRVGKSKKTRVEWVEPDGEDWEDGEDEDEDKNKDNEDVPGRRGTPDNDGNIGEGSKQPGDSPAMLAAFTTSRTSCRAFLATLSKDAKYQQLLQLLDAAKVSIFKRFGVSPD